MNKPSNGLNGVQARNIGPSQNSPTFSSFKPLIDADPKPTAKDPVPQVVPREPVKEPTPPTAPVKAQAAKGDDELMSRPQQEQQQQMSLPSVDEVKGKWKQHVGAAKIAWGKLTEDELLRLEGHEQKLAGLVQERYAITRDEADKQVKAFFDKQKS